MNNKEANRIIKNYKPHLGFYDLSEKPKTLTKIEYAKVLKIQEFLFEQFVHTAYLKEYASIQYEKDKQISANYQSIVKEHWDINKL